MQKKRVFYEGNKRNVQKRIMKNAIDKYTKLFKPNEKILKSNYCLSVPDSV